MTTDWNQNKFLFKDIHSAGYPTNLVHPYKQKCVAQLLQISLPSWITHILVFGSAVRLSHIWWKDVDICIIGKNPTKGDRKYRNCLNIPGYEMEFVEYSSIDALDGDYLGRNIKNEGVLIYER